MKDKRRRGVSSGAFDSQFPDLDDTDSIAYAVRVRALRDRKRTSAGLLRSLEHIARHEDRVFDDVVIDPEFLDAVAESAAPADREIVAESSEKLREWLTGADTGNRQRARYALIRFEGPTSELVASGLAGEPLAQIAAVRALVDPLAEGVATSSRALRFPVIPASLVPLVRPLFSAKSLAKGADEDDDDDGPPKGPDAGHLIQLLLRVEPGPAADEVGALLLAALDDEDFRPQLHRELTRGALSAIRMPATPAIRARFERGAAILEQSRKAGLPSRVEMTVLGLLAAFVGRDEALARRALTIFDLLGGKLLPGNIVTPFSQLLAASIDLLPPEALAQLAAFMTKDPEERLPAAAAAWVRLDPSKARELARRFNDGEKPRVEKRWLTAARAHLAYPDRKPEIASLIPEPSLGAALGDAPSDIARPILQSLVRKARNPAELLSALTLASRRAERSVLPAVLEKLRDTPFRIDSKVEPLLAPLMGPENEDAVRTEIDGENPFRDRREALSRLLTAALSRPPAR